MKGAFVYRHHVEPGVQLYVPKEETLRIPLKYVDVIRATHTDLDVLQEKRIDDDYQKCRSEQTLVRFLERIHKVHFIERKTSKAIYVVGRRLTKIQATTRSGHVCPEVWTKIGNAAQNRERQEWTKERLKLDNARRLRGIYFIDPGDEEYR